MCVGQGRIKQRQTIIVRTCQDDKGVLVSSRQQYDPLAHLNLLHETRCELLLLDLDARRLAVVAYLHAVLVVEAQDLRKSSKESHTSQSGSHGLRKNCGRLCDIKGTRKWFDQRHIYTYLSDVGHVQDVTLEQLLERHTERDDDIGCPHLLVSSSTAAETCHMRVRVGSHYSRC